jgi:hypothetical protein
LRACCRTTSGYLRFGLIVEKNDDPSIVEPIALTIATTPAMAPSRLLLEALLPRLLIVGAAVLDP